MTRDFNFDCACNGLVGAVQRAADPARSEWAPYVGCGGYYINAALWWTRHVMQMARDRGLYPTTAQLEAERVDDVIVRGLTEGRNVA